ncbi:uncharacterized protein LOC122506371 [Leptopilina heterotoma]|uniref:uncharacterized protein LOC122506371 n=1 Tax=Leptopilina heterotoma TaxID=63436 RepID=UPI001CA8E0F7|nr:uncharacterized protein LOC122506371 [Leptopilina heterotoma]
MLSEPWMERNLEFNRHLIVVVPPPCTLPRSEEKSTFFLIGDEIFPFTEFLMVPFARRNILNAAKENFNRRLSRARNTIEASFGFLVSTFQLLKQTLRFKLETSIKIVLAAVCLHNFLITRRMERGENIDFSTQEERPEVLVFGDREETQEEEEVEEDQFGDGAIHQREVLMNYFMSEAGAN